MFKAYILSLVFSVISVTAYEGDPIPSVHLTGFDGKEINLKEYTTNGKIQLVSLWATWCGPCKKELNALELVYPTWKEKYDLEIIAITVDTPRMLKKAKAITEKEAWPYTFFHDSNGELFDALSLRGIPYSMLIDQNGNIVSTTEGYQDGYEQEMEAKIKKLLK